VTGLLEISDNLSIGEGEIDIKELTNNTKENNEKTEKKGGRANLLKFSKYFSQELFSKGFIALGCSFEKDEFKDSKPSLTAGTKLTVNISDTKGRAGALIAHNIDKEPVGVVLNPYWQDLAYYEFIYALILAFNPSSFDARILSVGDEYDEHIFFTIEIKKTSTLHQVPRA
jgi:hypothetical protein